MGKIHHTRRYLLKAGGMTAGAFALGKTAYGGSRMRSIEAPSYLKGYEVLYQQNPRAAALEWFRDARFGLFLHYGLYSLLGRHEWVQCLEKIPVGEYEKLKGQFTAEKFDADFITDLALDAGMRYVNITTRHHDGFCLFDTKLTDFKSTNSPANRDLVAELAEQCQRKGLGLCLYYTHGRDWRHPHAPNNEGWGSKARPDYPVPEPRYARGEDHDLQKYLDFMTAQITELLTHYGPIAAIWLDGIGVPANPKGDNSKEMFKCQELYDHIHSLQPAVLVSYKQGLLGTEDFMAPERKWNGEQTKPLEICDTLQPRGWGYIKKDAGRHKSVDDVMTMFAKAEKMGANLLLNTGPLPEGSIHPEDIKTLRGIGQYLKNR